MSEFRFKQFGISQDKCAMKVGTDGVLLGAWAPGGKKILDVGTGTGLISLMMAQRFPKAQVVGIDIDADACHQATANVASSPFADRIGIVHSRLQDFMLLEGKKCLGEGCGSGKLIDRKQSDLDGFDAIVSNPPFFVNSLKNPDNKRSVARHSDVLPFRDLWLGVNRLLVDDGVFSVILPAEVKESFSIEGFLLGFCLVAQCAVKTVERKQPKRYLLTFARHRTGSMQDSVEIMMDKDGNRSEWYQKITAEFYL